MLPCCERPHPVENSGATLSLNNFRIASLDEDGKLHTDFNKPGVDPYPIFDCRIRYQVSDPMQGPYTLLFDEDRVYRITFTGELTLEREMHFDKEQMKQIKDFVNYHLKVLVDKLT